MKKTAIDKKHYSEATGKLHIPCPHKQKSGVYVHVVIREGSCYSSGECMVFECKFNNMQGKLETILSVAW